MQEQDVGTLLVKGSLDAHAGDFGVVLVDELNVVLDNIGGHACGGTALLLQLGALLMQFLGSNAQFLAEDLA